MPQELSALVIACMAGLLITGVLWVRKTGERWLLAILIALLVTWAVFLNNVLGFQLAGDRFPVKGKGPEDDLILVAALYLCMLAGIFAHHLYMRFDRPKRYRPKWDWGTFLAPVFASPIVFIPLLAAFSQSGIKLKELTALRLMIFVVAFQNGFFWREFFDRKRKEQAEGK